MLSFDLVRKLVEFDHLPQSIIPICFVSPINMALGGLFAHYCRDLRLGQPTILFPFAYWEELIPN